ncbi:MAG TPA: hypothetical protein VFX49_20960 [Chloroflexota bacterium]|nr:hypothetical protein [Chloroflexota bacterium]
MAALVVGLALRLPYVAEGDGYDARNYSAFATSVLEWGHTFDGYHQSRYSAFPFAHPPLFPILYAPLNWLALRTGGSYVAAANGLIYGFEVIAAVTLYALALRAEARPRWREWSAGLAAALLYLVPLSPLWLRWRDGPAPDTQYAWIAVAWLLGAVNYARSPKASGALLGLALATRSEMAFLVLPWVLHYARQSLTRAAWFAGAAGAVVAAVVGPFALRDWAAFDWALRGHLAGRLDSSGALLWRWTWREPPAALMASLEGRHGAVMLGAILAATLLTWRDRMVERRLTVVALAHVLTLPVFHLRYGAPALALSLALAARTRLVWLFAAWCAVALRLEIDALTVGLPLLALVGVGWLDRSPAEAAYADDPLRAWLAARCRDALRLPAWTPAAAVALGVTCVLIGRAAPEPALDARVGQLQVMTLLAGVTEWGALPPAGVVGWVAGLPGAGGAWRLNVLTAVMWGGALFLVGSLATLALVSRRAGATATTLLALASGAVLLAQLDTVEAGPQPFATMVVAGVAATVLLVVRGRVGRGRAVAAWLSLAGLVALPAVWGMAIPVTIETPDEARRLGVREAAALVGRPFVAWETWTWRSRAPESRTEYSDVVVSNLASLARDAVVCAGPAEVWGWWYATLVDRLRPDVTVRPADAETCTSAVIPAYAPGRPVYATALTEEDLRTSEWVFFPARGVWRAVAPRRTVGDGAVLKGPDDPMYLIEGERRRWIPTLQSFERAGLAWDRVQLVSAELMTSIPLGPPLDP